VIHPADPKSLAFIFSKGRSPHDRWTAFKEQCTELGNEVTPRPRRIAPSEAWSLKTVERWPFGPIGWLMPRLYNITNTTLNHPNLTATQPPPTRKATPTENTKPLHISAPLFSFSLQTRTHNTSVRSIQNK